MMAISIPWNPQDNEGIVLKRIVASEAHVWAQTRAATPSRRIALLFAAGARVSKMSLLAR